jgi:hypothetical protein
MAIYYFGTEKLNEKDFPSKRKYVYIVQPYKPTPDKGKKKLTTEQRKRYEHDMEQYNKCISLLESGHVDIYNNYLEPEDSDKFAVDILFDGIPENKRLFRIKPIQSKKIYGSYSSSDKLTVSEFDVEKEIKSADELLDILIENYDYFSLENKIFKEGTYDNKRDKAFEVFKKMYEKTGDKYLEDLIHEYMDSYNEIRVHSYYNNEKVHDYAKELMDAGYVKLFYEKDTSVWSFIIRLLKLKWTDFALEVVKAFIDNDEQIKRIKEHREIKALLSGLTDDSNVKEIIRLLEFETNKLILVVEEDVDDGYKTETVERKEFSDMGALRSYLITEYKMPFEMASKDIKDTYWNDMNFNVEQAQ